MFKNEEQLPLYQVEDNDKKLKYSKKTKYNYKSKKDYRINNKYQIDSDDESYHDNKNFKSLKQLYAENKYIRQIKNFIGILFNNKHLKVVYLFFILLLAETFEYFIGTFINYFPVKFSTSILFLIPYIIITLENEIFFQLYSTFELNFLICLKIIILLNKKMNLYEIIMMTLCAVLLESIFIKKIHVRQYYYSLDGNTNKKAYKIYVFESEIILIVIGIICNIAILRNLLKNKKLSFFLFDDIFIGMGDNDCQVAYFFLFEYLFLRKFIKYFYKYIFVYSENLKRKEKTIIINIIFIAFLALQIIFMNFFSCSFYQKIVNMIYIGLIIFLYESIGFLLYINMIFMSIIIYIANYIIEKNFTNEIIILIKSNLIYINISFLLSLLFIITIFFLEKKQISNYYILIYQRIFLIKIIFDVWLIIKYIYSLYKYNPLKYFDIFLQTYKFFFLSFLLNYFFVLVAVLIKLYIYINPEDVDYYFEDIIIFLNNKKIKGEVYYGGSAPYVEIKLYKYFSNLFSYLKEDISKSNKKTKAFQKILYSVLLCMFIFLCLFIDNVLLYFPIYFILIQFFCDILNDITFLVLNKISALVSIVIEKTQKKTFGDNFKKYQEDYIMQKYMEKINKKKMTIFIKKEKLKLFYLLLFFYFSIFWKKIFSFFFVFFYEKFISYWQYKLFGKSEPLGNILYQIIIMNYYNEENTKYIFREIFFLFVFLIPNSLAIVYSHYNETKINFFFQNYILTSLLPLFFNMDILIILLGFFNVFLMINLFSADEETYKNYKFWFFLFGIQSMDKYYL